jgi:hypothetical protein
MDELPSIDDATANASIGEDPNMPIPTNSACICDLPRSKIVNVFSIKE